MGEKIAEGRWEGVRAHLLKFAHVRLANLKEARRKKDAGLLSYTDEEKGAFCDSSSPGVLPITRFVTVHSDTLPTANGVLPCPHSPLVWARFLPPVSTTAGLRKRLTSVLIFLLP
jgi:hypothetical protein